MPKVVRGIPYNKKYKEEDIEKALHDVINNKMPKKTASKIYNIPRATLQNRLKQFGNNYSKKKFRHGPPTVLSDVEESEIVSWIKISSAKGFPRRKTDIQISVKEFLEQSGRPNPFKDNLPGEGWFKLFLRRHPSLSSRVAEGVTAASSVVSENDIKKWFRDIETYLKNEEYFSILEDPTRIYNGDETNFQLCPKQEKVIAPKGERNIYEVDSGLAKSSITVMFTFSAAGNTTPPMLIYPYKRLPKTIANSVPESWGIGLSDNGWMKAELFFEYIGNVLYPHLVQQNIKFPVILFVDGHKTHMTYKLSILCAKLKIILIALYPNSTRILQPADVAAFKPLKSGWKKGVLQWRRENPAIALTKEYFAPILEQSIKNYINANIIKNGFRACGLYPWNSNAINFTKCLGKRNLNSHSMNDDVRSILTYAEFKDIVGDEKINMFRNRLKQEKSVDFEALYNIWKTFIYKNNPEEVENNINFINNDELKMTVENDVEETLIDNENDVLCNEINTDIMNNISISSTHDLGMIIESENILNTDLQIDGITYDLNEIPFSYSNGLNLVDIEPPSEEYNQITDDNLHLSEPKAPTSVLSEFLVWPESPERKGVKQTEKLPFVLTSASWQNIQKTKLENKHKEQKEKEERKKKRLEKKDTNKKNEMIRKKRATSKSKKNRNTSIEDKNNKADIPTIINVNSDISLSNLDSGSKNVNVSLELENDMIRKNKEETISIKNLDSENNTTCKYATMNQTSNEGNINNFDIDNNNKSLKTKINIISCEKVNLDVTNILAEENVLLIKQHISKGICFQCLNNIRTSNKGIKCYSCTRTYHLKCVDLKNKNVFYCHQHLQQ